MVEELDMTRIPRHIAIIMDGNGRWATERNKPRSYGHQAGVETVRRITSECVRLGVKYLTLYTFSTENWNRPTDEIAALMGLVLTSLEDEIFMKNNVRFRVIGDREMGDNTGDEGDWHGTSAGECRAASTRNDNRRAAGQTYADELHARSRPPDQDRRRAAYLQLPALADSLFRTLLL